MFSVWYTIDGSADCLFVSGVRDRDLAKRIMEALVEEGFVGEAWSEME